MRLHQHRWRHKLLGWAVYRKGRQLGLDIYRGWIDECPCGAISMEPEGLSRVPVVDFVEKEEAATGETDEEIA